MKLACGADQVDQRGPVGVARIASSPSPNPSPIEPTATRCSPSGANPTEPEVAGLPARPRLGASWSCEQVVQVVVELGDRRDQEPVHRGGAPDAAAHAVGEAVRGADAGLGPGADGADEDRAPGLGGPPLLAVLAELTAMADVRDRLR